MSKEGMDKLELYRFQAKQIEDTLRMCANALESHDRKTCLDRNVMQSWQVIKNVLEGNPDLEAPYIPRQK